MGTVELFDEPDRFLGGVDEVGFRGGEGFEAEGDSHFRGVGDRGGERFPSPFPGLFVGDSLGDVALFGGADDDGFPSEIGAEIDQIAEVLSGALADSGIVVVHENAVSLDEDPMNSGDGDSGLGGRFADPSPFFFGDISDVIGDGEGRDFDGVISRLGNEGGGFFDFPVFEDLVADAEFHAIEDFVLA